jgi:hypothetical protein
MFHFFWVVAVVVVAVVAVVAVGALRLKIEKTLAP